jgi:PAS domain S-box-containing protein
MQHDEDNWNSLREKIIGLGERSVHKSYYPELQQQMEELKRFRALLDHTNDIIFLLDLPSGRIVDINESTLKQLRYTRPEMLEMVITDIIPQYESNKMRKLLINLQETGAAEGKKNITTTFLKKSGGQIPVEISISKVKFSKVLYAVMVSRDITERNEAQEALKQSEQKYRVLFESSPDFIALIDMEGKIIDINKSIGHIPLSKEELIGKTFTEIGILPEDGSKHSEFVGKMLENGNTPIELKIVDENGKIYFMESYTALLRKDKDNSAIQIIGHDITRRKKAEKQIKQSLKEKEVLLKEIHHRVKNNLQIISSLLNLQQNSIGGEEALEVFKESQNRIKSMALIHEKLYQSEDLTRIDFPEYIRSLVYHLFKSYAVDYSVIQPLINVEDILFDIDISIPCGLIINEIVSNSLKYAFPDGKKGKIEIDLHIEGDKNIIEISDNGIGIPEGLDIQNSDTLGLRLVNILVDQIDGKIELDNTNGTSIKIEFINVNSGSI